MIQLPFVIYELIWYAAFLATIVFAYKKMDREEMLAFFAPAILWGWLIEYTTQVVFARYHYGTGFLIYILNVPVNITLAWATIIFWVYWKIVKREGNLSNIFKAAGVAAGLDFLVFEPLANQFGFWIWTPLGLWFGSPIGNIFGWMCVVSLFLGAYELTNGYKQMFKARISKFFTMLGFLVPALVMLTILLKLWVALFGLV